MKNFFAILGGMGSISTENFIHGLNKYCGAKDDQEFLNYILFNNASIPDRTNYILDKTADNPIPVLTESLKMLDSLQPSFIVMPCNSAHVFFDEIKSNIKAPLINMIDLAVEKINESEIKDGARIGIAATQGTIYSKTYETSLLKYGYEPFIPDNELQAKITYLIYDNIKANKEIDLESYYEMLDVFKNNGCQAVILGCTEMSVFHSNADNGKEKILIFDADRILLEETIKKGKALNQ